MLNEKFMRPQGLTFGDLARESGISAKVIIDICCGFSDFTPELAAPIGRAVGTTGGFWVALQEEFTSLQKNGNGQ